MTEKPFRVNTRPAAALGGLAGLGALATGIIALLAGLVLLLPTPDMQGVGQLRIAAALCFVGAGLAFGLLANALFRQ